MAYGCWCSRQGVVIVPLDRAVRVDDLTKMATNGQWVKIVESHMLCSLLPKLSKNACAWAFSCALGNAPFWYTVNSLYQIRRAIKAKVTTLLPQTKQLSK